MIATRLLAGFVLLAANAACDNADSSTDPVAEPGTESPAMEDETRTADEPAAVERPQEAVSFAGEPLYRNPVPAERLDELTSQIELLETKEVKTEDDYIQLGHLYIASNRFRDAIDLYTRGLGDHPQSFKLLRHRGHRYLNVRELDKANADLTAAVELMEGQPVATEYRLNGEPNATYQHWIWYHVGLYNYFSGNYAAAAEAFQNAVDTAPDSRVVIGSTDWLYNAHNKAGNPDAAKAAIAVIPPDIEGRETSPYYKRVMLYKGVMAPEDILDIHKPAEEWTGADMTTGYGVGNWYLFNGDAETAEMIHMKVLQSPFWNAWAYVAADKDYEDRG